MITPIFSIKQDDDFLFIDIDARYANIKETEIEYFDKIFFFSSSPYFLRLHFPCEIIDNEKGEANYDSENGKFLIKVPKKFHGEFFPNLEMITELLKPSKIEADHLVQECGEENINDNEYYMEQTIEQKELSPIDEVCKKFGYGFGWRRHNVLGKLIHEIGNLIDLKNPESVLIEERSSKCLQQDQISFRPEHYLADLYEKSDILDECLNFQLPEICFELSSKDREKLKELGRRKIAILSDACNHSVILSLIDILFAYLYDLRTTDGEHNVESGWTIIKLSPTLTYLTRWKNAKEAITSAIRRALCYPLYRHWQLSLKVFDDVKRVISRGKVAILHCLCEIHYILAISGDFRYILNDLYLTDYCVWIQSVSDEKFVQLFDDLKAIKIEKRDVQLELCTLEIEAQISTLEIKENIEEMDSDDE